METETLITFSLILGGFAFYNTLMLQKSIDKIWDKIESLNSCDENSDDEYDWQRKIDYEKSQVNKRK